MPKTSNYVLLIKKIIITWVHYASPQKKSFLTSMDEYMSIRERERENKKEEEDT